MEISLQQLLYPYCPYHAAKFEKKSLEPKLRYRLIQFWATIEPKLPTWLRRGFFGKFHLNNFSLMIFCYLLRPIMLESLKNISDGGCCSISLHNFGPQLGQNIQFGPKENFSGNFTLVNLSTYCALSCCKI